MLNPNYRLSLTSLNRHHLFFLNFGIKKNLKKTFKGNDKTKESLELKKANTFKENTFLIFFFFLTSLLLLQGDGFIKL